MSRKVLDCPLEKVRGGGRRVREAFLSFTDLVHHGVMHIHTDVINDSVEGDSAAAACGLAVAMKAFLEALADMTKPDVDHVSPS